MQYQCAGMIELYNLFIGALGYSVWQLTLLEVQSLIPPLEACCI